MILLKVLLGILLGICGLICLAIFFVFTFATLPSLWVNTIMYGALTLCGMLIYFLPSVVAIARYKKNTLAIFAANLLVGWTFIGWVICFIWALTKD